MNPSNQHSPAAIVAYPDVYMRGYLVFDKQTDELRTAYDRGRESKQHTDRETLIGVLKTAIPKHSRNGLIDLPSVADAILAAPSLSLVAARRDFAEKASAHMRANGHGFTRRIDMELLYDALFASGTLKPSSEVEAAALEAAVEGASGTAAEAIRARAARVRSGKDE